MRVRLFSALVVIALTVGVIDIGVLYAGSRPTGGARAAAVPAASDHMAGSPTDPTVSDPIDAAPGSAGAPVRAAALPIGTRRVGPWRVGTMIAHFVDVSRPAPPRVGGGPGRALDTVLQYPIDGDPAAPAVDGNPEPAGGGPFPLVVFAHGFDVTPTTYMALTQAWARAGYVVASPAFPGEVGGSDGATQDDLVNEPADVRFIISSMMAATAPIRSAVDATRIAVAGHSDGAETAAAVGLDRCCHDPRVGATIVMSGAEFSGPGSGYAGVRHAPVLILQSDSDEINDPSNAVRLYNDSPGQVWFLSIIGGRHLEPYLGTDPKWGIVVRATTDFLNLTLKNSQGRLERFERDAIVPGVGKLYLKK